MVQLPQARPAAAGNPERLHGAGNVLNHDGRRNDKAGNDDIRFFLAQKGLLLDIESEPEVAVAQILRGKATRDIDVRDNGRLDKCDTHFDFAPAGLDTSICLPAGYEAGAFRTAVSSVRDGLLSLSFSHSSQIVNGCNNWLNGTRSDFMSGSLIATRRKGFPQIAGEGTGYGIRQNEPINDPMLFAVRNPGDKADFTVNPFHVDTDRKDVVDDIGLGQRWVAFVSHFSTSVSEFESHAETRNSHLVGRVVDARCQGAVAALALDSLPLELPLPCPADRLGASPPVPSHQFTMVSA